MRLFSAGRYGVHNEFDPIANNDDLTMKIAQGATVETLRSNVTVPIESTIKNVEKSSLPSIAWRPDRKSDAASLERSDVRRTLAKPTFGSDSVIKLLCATALVSAAIVATVLVRGRMLQSNASKSAERVHLAELKRLNTIDNVWNGHPSDGLLVAE